MVFNNLTSGGTGWILGQNISGIGTGTFGIAGGTAGVILKADPTSGLITASKAIAFTNAINRKRLALWDTGTPGDLTDHKFSGFWNCWKHPRLSTPNNHG